MVARIVRDEGALQGDSPSLVAITAVKSTATLLRRTGSIKLYRAWFVTAGLEYTTFFSELAAYRYFQFLHDERAPATRASGMFQVFCFLGGSLRCRLRTSRGAHAFAASPL